MRQEKWFLLMLVLLIAGTTGNWIYHGRVMARMDDYQVTLKESNMTTLTTKWRSSGQERSLTSNRRDSETLQAFAARHAREVVAAQVVLPVDG